MILQILEELSATSKTNEKLLILARNKNNTLLKDVLFLTYDPYINFYIRSTTYPTPQSSGNENLEKFVSTFAKKLYSREFTGNAAIEELKNELEKYSTEDQDVIKRIVLRDLRCGISEKSINKVWPNLIKEFTYMRCSSIDSIKNIKYPAVIQEKCDGAFANCIIDDSTVKFMTRNGTEFSIPHLENIFKDAILACNGYVLIGELLSLDELGVIEERKIGNGKINRITKFDQTIETLNSRITDKNRQKIIESIDTATKEFDILQKNIIFKLWDIVPVEAWKNGKYNVDYRTRFGCVEQLCNALQNKYVTSVKSKIVKSFEEAEEFNNEQISSGNEGSVLKNLSAEFKNGTSKEQIKMKSILDADLLCIGWYYGKEDTVFANGIGGLNLQSSDGIIKVDVGSGLTREQRGLEPIDKDDISKGLKQIDGFDFDQYIGKIITIEYNAIINTNDSYSLFLPVFIEVRNDKTVADSYEKLSNQ